VLPSSPRDDQIHPTAKNPEIKPISGLFLSHCFSPHTPHDFFPHDTFYEAMILCYDSRRNKQDIEIRNENMSDVPCERTLTDDIEYQTYIERLKEICLDTFHENYLAEVLIPLLRSSCINGIKIVPVFDDRASGARPKTVTKTRKRTCTPAGSSSPAMMAAGRRRSSSQRCFWKVRKRRTWKCCTWASRKLRR